LAVEINIQHKVASKEERYQQLLPQIKALISGEESFIANISNIASALKYGMNFFWVGYYFVADDELVLGPFQGPVACARMPYGKGVCGKAWETNDTILVEDVDEFPGHISCNSASKSEIVLPIRLKDKTVKMILDVDSDKVSYFDQTDKIYLGQVVELIEELLHD